MLVEAGLLCDPEWERAIQQKPSYRDVSFFYFSLQQVSKLTGFVQNKKPAMKNVWFCW
jgi:hypothetical protein